MILPYNSSLKEEEKSCVASIKEQLLAAAPA
jgi:hypothetical protein